ncbi:MAG TPA: GNAT family N-acetyltransferase [Propionibacteriaceae bacterium]|jgi:GNAT superfamily N-acetyltransferase|nr:GNAT family N-acetyltransferase [Propionibacteriaceae bacterium]
MTDPLVSARVGERWVIRVRLPDGSATDRIGWLDAVTADAVVLTGPDGRPETVDLSTVVVARRAPAAAGGPDPRRVSVAEVERHALPGWLADSEPLGEWTLRAAAGFTGRANSCHAVGDPGMPAGAAAERIVAYAARHGIAPMAMVVSGSAEEQALRGLGWVDTYVPTQVSVARLADVLGDRAVPEGVRVQEELTDAWLATYARSRPLPADRTVVERILTSHPPRAFAAMESDAIPVAIGRGHVSGSWFGVAAVWVDPEHRRRDRATAIMTALGHWAARQGCRYAYVQVDQENEVALTAYQRLGFRPHHGYLYLMPSS